MGMIEGFLQSQLIKKIADYENNKKVSAAVKNLIDISKAYLTYTEKYPEDKNDHILEELTSAIDFIIAKKPR